MEQGSIVWREAAEETLKFFGGLLGRGTVVIFGKLLDVLLQKDIHLDPN